MSETESPVTEPVPVPVPPTETPSPNPSPATATLPFYKMLRENKLLYRRIPVRSSYASDFISCPRYFMFRNRLGLKMRSQGPNAASVGSLYHLMVEGVMRGQSSEESLRAASQELQAQITAMEEASGDDGLMPDGTPSERLRADFEQAFSVAQVMFMFADQTFLQAPWIKSQGWVTLSVEEPIEITLPKIGTIRCKPDAVLHRPSDDSLAIVNHKTTGKGTAMLAASYRFCLQPRIERLLVATKYNKNVKFYIHNIIKRPTLKFPSRNSPTFDAYIENVRQWYADETAKNPQSPPLLQSLIATSGPLLDEELAIQLRLAARSCTARLNPAAFFRVGESCNGKFGNSSCRYLRLCNEAVQFWPDAIKRDYIQEWREDEEDAELTTE